MYKKIITVLIVIQFLVACNGLNEMGGEKNYTDPTEQSYKTNKKGIQATPIVKRNSGETANAKELVQLTEQVKGVESARAVVSGLYIVVGARLKDGVNHDKTVKAIYEQISGHSHGANAFVTTDREHIKTLDEWGTSIKKKKVTTDMDIYNGLGVMISKIKPNENLEIRNSHPSKEELDLERLPDVKK